MAEAPKNGLATVTLDAAFFGPLTHHRTTQQNPCKTCMPPLLSGYRGRQGVRKRRVSYACSPPQGRRHSVLLGAPRSTYTTGSRHQKATTCACRPPRYSAAFSCPVLSERHRTYTYGSAPWQKNRPFSAWESRSKAKSGAEVLPLQVQICVGIMRRGVCTAALLRSYAGGGREPAAPDARRPCTAAGGRRLGDQTRDAATVSAAGLRRTDHPSGRSPDASATLLAGAGH